MFFTDDVQADYESMKARGAEFTMPPTDVTASKIAMLNDLRQSHSSHAAEALVGGCSAAIRERGRRSAPSNTAIAAFR
jgi:hypothetical protein